jgi:polyhydroxybutyrate depolymerase
MKKLYASCVLVFSILSTLAQQSNQTIAIGNATRAYIEYLPTNFNASQEDYSLVIILHGLGQSNTDFVAAGFNDLADTARVIALYPQGLNNFIGQPAWNNGTLLASTADDVGLLSALMDKYISQYGVDPARVYVTGFSMGSIMSYTAACALNDRIAAIGCMAGTMSTNDLTNCNPNYATPVIHLHGTADGTVPYGAGALPSLSLVPQTVEFWQNVHNCDAEPDSIGIDDTANDGITVDRFVYNNCNTEGALELWRFNGADHIYLYEPVNDITEMIEVWLFFRKWTHPAPLEVGISEINEASASVFPNPTADVISVKYHKDFDYKLVSTSGAIVKSGYSSNADTRIDISQVEAGVYFLQINNSIQKIVITPSR